MPKLIASRSFSGPDGKHKLGETFLAPAERVAYLIDNGYAAKPRSDAAQVAVRRAAEHVEREVPNE